MIISGEFHNLCLLGYDMRFNENRIFICGTGDGLRYTLYVLYIMNNEIELLWKKYVSSGKEGSL